MISGLRTRLDHDWLYRCEQLTHATTTAAFLVTILLVTTGAAAEANAVAATLLSSVGWTATGMLALAVVTATFMYLDRQQTVAPRAVAVGAVVLAGLGIADLAVNLWVLNRVGLPESVHWAVYGRPMAVMAAGGALAIGRRRLQRLVSGASMRQRLPRRQTVGAIVLAVVLAGSVIGPVAVFNGMVEPEHDHEGVASAQSVDWTKADEYTQQVDIIDEAVIGGDGYLYLASDAGNIHKVDPSDMTQVDTYTQFTAGAEALAWGDDGYLYAGEGYDNANLHKINPTDMSQVSTYSTGFTSGVSAVDYGADGNLYIGYSGGVQQVDPSDMTQVDTFTDIDQGSNTVKYGGDGNVYLGTSAGEVIQIDPSGMSQTGEEMVSTSARSVEWGDGFVYASDGNSAVEKIDPSDMVADATYTGLGGDSYALHYGADGWLYAASNDNDVHRISPSDMSQADLYSGHPASARAVTMDEDGSVFSSDFDGATHKSDPGTSIGQPLSGTVTNPDGTAVEDVNIRVYEQNSDTQLASTQTNEDGAYSFDSIPEDFVDITAGRDGYDTTTTGVDVSGPTTKDITVYEDGLGPHEHTIGVCYEGNAEFRSSTASATWSEAYHLDGRFNESAGNVPEYLETRGETVDSLPNDDGEYVDANTVRLFNLHDRTEFNYRQNTSTTGIVENPYWYYYIEITTDRASLTMDGFNPTSEEPYSQFIFNPPFEDSDYAVDDDGEESDARHDCPGVFEGDAPEINTVPGEPAVNQSVRLTADYRSDIESYEWAFEDGTTKTGRQIQHTWSEDGLTEVTLTVTDGNGATNTRTENILVTEPLNLPPEANMEWSPENPDPGEAVTFTANVSDGDDIDEVRWRFEDANEATGEEVSYEFESAGLKLVELQVTASGGETAERVAFVEVGDGVPPIEDPASGDGWGPAVMGTCTGPDGEDGISVEYWDPSYATDELTYNLSEGGETYSGKIEFDDSKGYVMRCVGDQAFDPENPEDVNGTLSNGTSEIPLEFDGDRESNSIGAGDSTTTGGFVSPDAGSGAPLALTVLPAAAAIGWVVLRRRRGGGPGNGGNGGALGRA